MAKAPALVLKSLGFPVCAWVRSPRQGEAVPIFAGPDQLEPFLRQTDIAVCLLPLTPETEGIFCARTFAMMPKGSMLVNIGRGSVVVTADLVAALEQRRIGGAALDVFDDEPAVPDALKRLSNTVLTSHVAGLSPEAAHDTVQRVADNLLEYFAGRPVLTPVALPPPEK